MQYHAGFRSQSANWPIHPLTLLTKSLSTLPPHSLIVDFGAGDAQLARTLSTPPLTLKVISFDLVSKDGWVIVAECSSVPLPGQGGKEGGAEIVDAVVCCLSLMGTDWVKMIREARRILKTGSVLFSSFGFASLTVSS
jgi:ribosomal RNA-processing protein 8